MLDSRLTLRVGLPLAALLLLAPALPAQTAPVRVDRDTDCGSWDSGHDRYCEVREYTLEARPELAVDAGANGGIEVVGWDRDEVRLVARIQANSRDGDPAAIARAVEVRTGRVIEADGPRRWGGDGSWSVSFDLMVPRSTRLDLDASNGGIDLEGLTGEVEARTTNGGLRLTGGAGRVRGQTTNGGVEVRLTGAGWQGGGVDLRTTNGGVHIVLPDGYSAELETGTVNGGIDLDLPVVVQGRITRTIRTQLGDGGALIRATTTNGGVRVTR